MLSIAECRRLLGDKHMNDQEIAQLLKGIRLVNAKFLDEYFKDELSDDDDV